MIPLITTYKYGGRNQERNELQNKGSSEIMNWIITGIDSFKITAMENIAVDVSITLREKTQLFRDEIAIVEGRRGRGERERDVGKKWDGDI